MIAVVERSTALFEELVERRPGAIVGAAGVSTGAVLAAVDGMTASTAAATAVATATVAIVTLVVRVLLTDIRSLRARIRELEHREDARIAVLDDERVRLLERIALLEARLTAR